MKHIHQYQCEICKIKYDDEEAALDCEAQGLSDKSKIPIGLMYEYHHHDFVGIFAVAQVRDSFNSHWLDTSAWASRTPKFPKGLFIDHFCTGIDFIFTDERGLKDFAKLHKVTKEKVDCREFKLMVQFLKENNIRPSYYDEEGNLIKF